MGPSKGSYCQSELKSPNLSEAQKGVNQRYDQIHIFSVQLERLSLARIATRFGFQKKSPFD